MCLCILVSLFLSLFVLNLRAMDEGVNGLTTVNGLSSNTVLAVTRDRQGFVYFGTTIGIDRFDGERVINIPFTENIPQDMRIVSCLSDIDNRWMLVGSYMGLWKLDKRELKLTRCFEDVIKGRVTCLLKISETACYVGTNRGLYLIKGNKVVRCKIKDRSFGDNITDMSGDGKRIWVAGKKGIAVFRNMSSVSDGSVCHTKKEPVSLVRIGRRLFIGTSDSGVWQKSDAEREFSHYMFHGQISDMNKDGKSLLVATAAYGAYEINTERNVVVNRYSEEASSDNVRIRIADLMTFYRDKYGCNWFGSIKAGVDYTYYNRNIFHVFSIPSVLTTRGTRVYTCFRKGDWLLWGTDDGLYITNLKNGKLVKIPSGELDANIVTGLMAMPGNYVVGTDCGVRLVDMNTFTVKSVFGYGSVFSSVTDRNGCLWFATDKGLLRYDAANNVTELFTKENSDIAGNYVMGIDFDSYGKGWLSTDCGIQTLTLRNGKYIFSGKVPKFLADCGNMRRIYHMANGMMLFVPVRGFPVMSNQEVTEFAVKKYDINESVPSFCFVRGTEMLLFACTEQSVNLLRNGKLRKLGYIDGLPGLLIEQNSYGYSVLDQKYWMATDKGLVWAHEKDLMSHDFDTIPIAVTKIISDHVFTAEEVSRVNFDNTLHIKKGEGSFNLMFTCLAQANMSGLSYKYRLEGFEDEWHVTSSPSLSYSDVPAGTYVLRIEVCGMPEICMTMKVIVVSDWFAVACAAVLIVLACIAGWILVRRAVERKVKGKEESEQVQENADSLHETEEISDNNQKYQSKRLSQEQADILQKKLNDYMKEHKPYLNKDLQMRDISDGINCSAHELSQLFSLFMHTNYYDYIAGFRVEAIKKMIALPEYRKFTITAISEKCGFKSRSTFLSAFKRIEGVSPSEYIKSLKEH